MGLALDGIWWTLRCAAVLLALSGAAVAETATAELHIPTCAQFLDIGQKWVGLDEAVAAEVLGLPLYKLSDDDIDRIDKSLRDCAHDAGSGDEKATFEEDRKQVPVLRAARNRVRRAFADFTSAKKNSQRKLEEIAAKLDALPASPASRGAVDDAQATVSAIFFELDQKRMRAQVKEPLVEDFPAYSEAMAALARKRRAYIVQEQNELVTNAAEALEQHRAEFERLSLPTQAQDAAIILQEIDAGRDVRWLTLRQWAALLLSNPENTSVKAEQQRPAGDPPILAFEIVRPGYSTAEFGFRLQGHDLLLVESGTDGDLDPIGSSKQRQEANSLLLDVVEPMR
jgi:hypothetical protein